MNIGALGQSYQAEFRKNDGARADRAKAKAAPADSPSISSKAAGADINSATVDAMKSQIALAPDIREEKVAAVREKILRGEYNSPEVIEHLANTLARSMFLV